MNDRPFADKNSKPTPEMLAEALGEMNQYYLDLNKQTEEFEHAWNFSKSSGWMEKVSDSKKLYTT